VPLPVAEVEAPSTVMDLRPRTLVNVTLILNKTTAFTESGLWCCMSLSCHCSVTLDSHSRAVPINNALSSVRHLVVHWLVTGQCGQSPLQPWDA
jgi:hypothetical protein